MKNKFWLNIFLVLFGFFLTSQIAEGGTVYVSNENNTVSVINTSTNTITATVNVGKTPTAIAATPDRSKVYVRNSGDDTISVIDTFTNSVLKTIPLGIGGKYPDHSGIAVSPDGSKVYIGGYSAILPIIDTATDTIKGQILGTLGFQSIIFSPDGKKAYGIGRSSLRNTSIYTIDVLSNTVTEASYINADSSIQIAISPDGKKLYLPEWPYNSIYVFDTSTKTVTDTINIGSSPTIAVPGSGGIAISPNGSKIYAVNPYDSIISVIDTSTNTVSKTIDIDGGTHSYYPSWITFSNDGNKAYVAGFGTLVIDALVDTILSKISGPFALSEGIVFVNDPSPFPPKSTICTYLPFLDICKRK